MSRHLPPLNAVRAFEAASRHLNLSRAAEELGVTQGAISKHVTALEDFIGAQLFDRTPSGLILTIEGHALRDSLRPAFELMGQAFERYHRRPPRSSSFRISTVASMAALFLVPRLDAFHERFPGVELEILASTRVVDLAREEVDLSIRHGRGDWEDVVSAPLCDGRLQAVCAPSLIAEMGGDAAELIARVRRVQTTTANEWRPWAKAAGLDLASAPPAFLMEDFLVALRLAAIGQGLLLLPEILLRDPVARGEVAPFSSVDGPSDVSFHIVSTPGASRRQLVEDVAGWLLEQARPLA